MTFQKKQFSSRDGSSTAKIFPEIARESLLTGYKNCIQHLQRWHWTLKKVRILYMTDILKGSHYPQSLCNDSFVGFLTPRVFTYANAPSKMAKQPMSLPTTSFAGEI